MKLTVMSLTDPKDKRTWSGTTSNMYEALKRNGLEVDTLTLKNWFTRFYIRATMFYLNRIKKQGVTNFETTVLGAKYWGKRADKLIHDQDKKSNYYFCPAGASIIAFAHSQAKFVDLPDATYALMNNYYYAGVDKKGADNGDEIDQKALTRADKIILPSQWAYKSVQNDYDQPEGKLSLIPFGANMPDVKITPKTLTSKEINILLVGVEWKRKGVDIALDIVAKLNENSLAGYHYTLTIVGLDKPSDFTQSDVIFKGRLDKNDPAELSSLQAEYEQADLFLLPTQAEAAGIVFAEAAMYALPVFTYNTGGVSQYVLNGKTGYALPTSANSTDFVQQIEALVTDDTNYHNMSRKARDYYDTTLNWDAWADSVKSFLKS
ncbi:glycosyltransferase family 4 protein [Ligilactobacillus animalis]|uniref:Glycosyltransferase, GG-Bacteroidales peptide system n=1 Tax=Ligilactobacillus animalis TaxID=1605 RepID=A0ABR4RSA2_9LACO|nr:glycosyltransferase family 4 protein [Ligilactobacillus animalis]KDA46846.1 glycosyltransferase, GG-Bacteroidales peptide system [Ligilactobacillus animalis]MEE0260288.1 glycosyltransferase family 4 protein [Ligilactobacillus animalis]